MTDTHADSTYTVLLYYKYVTIADTVDELTQFVVEHEKLCQSLHLNGRVRIAKEGINGTLGGSGDEIAQYVRLMEQDVKARFIDVDWKTSTSNVTPFPELLVRLVNEIVALELPDEACDLSQGGIHLTPAQFHAEQMGNLQQCAIIDVRNNYEYSVGHFEHAMNPNTRRFSQFPEWVRSELPQLQQKEKILMYCTGGIRCEKASAYLKHLGLQNVYQLQGGIHRYLEQFPDGGQFRGKNFVFDQRVTMSSEDETIAGRCVQCDVPYDHVSGLRCQYCRTHVMLCPSCQEQTPNDLVFCIDHKTLVEGTLGTLQQKQASLNAALAQETGHSRKSKRRSLRKQLGFVQARIQALCV